MDFTKDLLYNICCMQIISERKKKFMKNIGKKISALALTAVLTCSIASCTLGPGKWSYKTDISEISAGSWIYNTYQSYNEAVSKITEANKDNEDFDAQLIDMSKEKIDDKNAVDWIFDEAKDKCISLLTAEKLVKDKGIVIDDEQIKTTADMYIQYYYKGSDDSLAFYEKLGVSADSFGECVTRYNYLYQELFKKIYGKDGEKEVSDADVQKYYADSYISYYYIAYSLKTTDEDGNSVDVDGETQEKNKTAFNKYRNMINNDKKTTADIEEQYKTDFSAESVPSSSNKILKTDFDESSLSDELKKAIKENKPGQASVTTLDDTLYFIYTDNMSELAKKIKYSEDAAEGETDNIDKSNIVYSMKKDEFDEYLEGEKKALKYETNDACISAYTVDRAIKIAKQG